VLSLVLLTATDRRHSTSTSCDGVKVRATGYVVANMKYLSQYYIV
jgi:hypothetical protein